MKKTIILLAAVLGITANAQTWNLAGNAGTTATDFIGTTDAQPLIFKTNNAEKMKINPDGRFIFFNVNTPGQLWDKNLFFGGGINNATTFNNAVFGMGAFTQNTVGGGNTALGTNSMSLMTSGEINVSVGFNSMRNTQGGSSNVAVGMNSLEYFQNGNGNVGVGTGAMEAGSLVGDSNVAVGLSALRHLNSGNSNVVLGAESFRAISKGSNNINVGFSNARYITSGSNNIFIGSNITPYNTTSPNNELNIGNWIVGNNGTIGIGTFTAQLPVDGIAPDGEKYKLFVKDGIRTEKVKVDIAASNGWADYVFEKDYKLMSLNDLSQFINENGHLPEVPTTKEAIDIGQFTNQLPADGISSDGEKYKLFVKDGIRTEKVKVDIAASNGWADYVFEKDYKLMALNDLSEFINKNGHLPEVPTTKEAIENGIELKEMNILLLKKIEELTLHAIEQQKRIEVLEKKMK